jgi:hypothetical protein
MAVGAVVFPKRARQFFDGMAPWMVTGSKDKTIKVPPCGTALGPGRPTAPPPLLLGLSETEWDLSRMILIVRVFL